MIYKYFFDSTKYYHTQFIWWIFCTCYTEVYQSTLRSGLVNYAGRNRHRAKWCRGWRRRLRRQWRRGATAFIVITWSHRRIDAASSGTYMDKYTRSVYLVENLDSLFFFFANNRRKQMPLQFVYICIKLMSELNISNNILNNNSMIIIIFDFCVNTLFFRPYKYLQIILI